MPRQTSNYKQNQFSITIKRLNQIP